MVTERATLRPHRRARPAPQIALQHLRPAAIRKEPEQLDRRPEQRDHTRADSGCHVHHAGVARDDDGGARETRAGVLQRELSRGAVHAGTELTGELGVAPPGAADGDESVSHRAQLFGEGDPVANGPALGRMCGARGERRERLAIQAALGEPARDPLARRRRQKKLGWAAVGLHVECARRLEVALGDRHVLAVDVDLRRDQRGPGELALGIGRPLAWHEQAQRGTPEAAVQVEPVRRPERAQPAREVGDPLVRLELDDPVEVRILDQQRRQGALGDEIQLRVGMTPVQRAHERSGEEDVADGAEPDAQDAQHAANVVLRCPASPAGLACHTMPRPKSILWVDDEVDGLAAHRRFLEEQGFAVAQAAHGDDALAMLRRQPYSVVLLDEQMPGRRGLDLLPEIRAIDPAMAVVMVTQSEDDGLLRDAIGTEIDDYLVKPVHPRQVLSVVTRLLEGDRIRQQRLARDFVTRFRELEGRRGGALAWREWIELVRELAQWEVRLAAGNEPGLSEALKNLQESLRKDFATFITKHYPRWLADPEGDRPPLSVDVGAEFLVPALKRTGRVLFLVIDCLRLDQWEVLRDLITPLFDVEESHYYSILPTATPFSRNAIFSGLFPMEIAARHPEWWGAPTDEESLNAHEAELLTEQLRELVGENVPVRYEPVLLTTDHGSIHCETPATVFAKRDATANLRYKFGEDLRSEDPEAAIMVEDLKAYGLPAKGLGVRLLLATGDRFFVYPTKLREYQARYRGAFLHGGATPEEMI